jgi:transcriptional regulator with XRE-family HTH domain
MPFDSIGEKMKSLRKERKLTLKSLAEQTGVSISFLSQVERGKSSVTLESLKKIADTFRGPFPRKFRL